MPVSRARFKNVMCGIAGLVSGSPINNKELLLAMRNSLRHRGPDDAGVWWSADDRVGLAHQRLAIIDLSPGGHQPMSDDSGQLRLIFNGEIYNYKTVRDELKGRGFRFRTASDTEVILAAYRAWGLKCLGHLNGMFAFALYDDALKRLFLARDRAGEKPLFYWHARGRLAFCSELKALMADPFSPRELDLQSLNHYLAYGYAPGDMCMLRGVRKLAQGHAMTYELDSDTLHVWRYWQLPEPRPTGAPTEKLMDELEDLLMDSVRMRMIADVAVGILLSGGIDSSLVTALAARISSKPVKTYTVSFPGYEGYDEGPYARLVARHFRTEHTELVADTASVDLLPEMAAQFDEPIADSSMIPTYLISRLIRQHATVALGGDGGDELFGGYLHYCWILQEERFRPLLPVRIRSWIAALARNTPLGLRGRNHLIGFADGLAQSIAHVNLYFDAQARLRLLSPDLRSEILPHLLCPESYKAGLCSLGDTPVQKATAVDFMTYLVDDLLVKIDRASMLASLEVRAPWLDHRIIEFAFGRVPDTLRATVKERKILLRRMARRLLPADLNLNRKHGFSIPLEAWFKGIWGRFIESVLLQADSHLFDGAAIRSLIRTQRCSPNAQRLFALALLELWRRHYGVSVPGV